MGRSLLAKITAGLAALLVIAGAGFLALTVRTSRMYEQEVQQRLNAELAAHIADTYALVDGKEVNQESLATLFTELMHVNPAIEVYLLDATGEILAFLSTGGARGATPRIVGARAAPARGRGRWTGSG